MKVENFQRSHSARVAKALCVLALAAALVGCEPRENNAANTSADTEQPSGNSADTSVIQKFVQATQGHEDSMRGSSIQVSIEASIPKLKEHGTLKALRRISRVGTVVYRNVKFQGDTTIKNEVIARYLSAEQQTQGDQSIAITPANYKFKSKGTKSSPQGEVYVFQLTPRKKRVGLFKGELWVDAKTYVPVLEKGKLVKNPSIWFKQFEFERDFKIEGGVAIPKRVEVTADVRLFGKVEMDINYSDYQPNAQADADDAAEPQSVLGNSPAAAPLQAIAWLY